MGQRLDRHSTAATSVPANVGPGAVTSSLSTTFSSLSASSTSSTSSNTSAVNNSNTQGNATSSNSTNAPPNSNSHHRHHRHRHRNHISRGSVPETSLVGASSTPNSSSTTTAAAVAAASDMSPRTRFRTEMARRGYTNSSSDLFFRLFQFPNQQSTATTTSARGESTLTNSSSSQAANTPNIEPLSATPVTSNVVTASRATTGNSSGLSAFRFFNLGGGGGGSSSGQAGDLDSDLSSDEDEPHWNHNLNSLTQSLPFFFGVRDFKCFVCSKQIPADDVEAHIMMCLTKPRLTYNDDVLTGNKGECIICFEELEKGQTIARLPCLCIYHKHCIESWLERSQSCPGHPPD